MQATNIIEVFFFLKRRQTTLKCCMQADCNQVICSYMMNTCDSYSVAMPYRPRPLPLDPPPLLLLLPLPLPLPPLPPLGPPSRPSLYLIGLFSNPTKPPLPDLGLLLPHPLHIHKQQFVLEKSKARCLLVPDCSGTEQGASHNQFLVDVDATQILQLISKSKKCA